MSESMPCVNFQDARPGMWLYHRAHPHGSLSIMSIFDCEFYCEDYKIGLRSIILRIPCKVCNKEYYDVSFLPDGRQREGGFLMGSHSIYPVIDRYKALYEFEQFWGNNGN